MKALKKILVISMAVTLLLGSTLCVSAAELRDLFDAEHYAEQYEDVVAVYGTDPDALYEHYITYGIHEGRFPSQMIDVRSYRSKYSDLEKAFGDDWAAYVNHYLEFGLSEGRDGGGEFDAVSYANRYPDLYEAYGYDLAALYNHYQTFGINENRDTLSQDIVEEREAAAAGEEDSSASEPAVKPERVIEFTTEIGIIKYTDGTYWATAGIIGTFLNRGCSFDQIDQILNDPNVNMVEMGWTEWRAFWDKVENGDINIDELYPDRTK